MNDLTFSPVVISSPAMSRLACSSPASPRCLVSFMASLTSSTAFLTSSPILKALLSIYRSSNTRNRAQSCLGTQFFVRNIENGSIDMDGITVEAVRTATNELRDLIDELDRTLAREYLPEQRHGLSLDA